MTGQWVSRSLTTTRSLLTRRVSIDFDRIPFDFQQVPRRKLLNWLLAKLSMHLRPIRPWAWPTHLQVEPSTLCNLRCVFCPVTTGLQRPTGLMDLETFREAIDQIGEYLFLINLWSWGEPFVNPAAYDMIAYAKQRAIQVVSSTNGHVFARGDNAEKLVRSGIDSIIFAVDGLRQETYERYRAGGQLEDVLAGVRRVVAAKHAMKATTPLIHLRFLAMRHNEHEIPELETLARSLGVDALSIKTMNPFDRGELHSTKADGIEFIPKNPRYQRFEYDNETGARIWLEANPCLRLWNHPALHWDGTVSPCDFDAHNHYAVGHLRDQSFGDIWWGTGLTELRRQFRRDHKQQALCAGCSYAFKGGNCATETIAEAHLFQDASVPG